ncbi:InlB B-repeat-containing protein [Enterococcus asini]|uniref:InlB B-repeat-containing protein n=1 Tax=Enterococcus asini TaxID=57732 RepID=UPI00288D6690|nr:InlB B-repeat-containing protein [Enterococcus asini]MDT2757606.1 InlB B-repeat-containing protein [Enterococcus asini]
MKKFWKLWGVTLICAQVLLPIGQVVAYGEDLTENDEVANEQVVTANEDFTSVETEDYLDSSDYAKFGFDIAANAPETFNANDGDNPLLGVEQTYFDEMYLGYINKHNKNEGLFSVKENFNTEEELKKTSLDNSPYMIVPSDTVEVSMDQDPSKNDLISSQTDLERINNTNMLHQNDPELISYKAQNVIGFVGDQKTRISDTITELKGDKAKQKQSMEEQLAINKGFCSTESVKNSDDTVSKKKVGLVSRLNSDDLYLNDQTQYIFESVLYYGKYNGGLTKEEINAQKTSSAASGIRLTAYKLDTVKKQYVPVGDPYVKQLASSRNTDGAKYLKRLEAKNSMALTALAKGDYDKDGREEVAVYFPEAGDEGTYIAFFEISNGKLEEKVWPSTGDTHRIMLSEMDQKFAMKVTRDGKVEKSGSWERENMPSVHLHTTKVGGKDQLVINATLPRSDSKSYKEKSHKALMAIYDYRPENSKAMTQLGATYGLESTSDKSKEDNVRMQYAAATDGDIDGDGDQELVVVGYKETDYEGNKFKYGDIHDTELYLRVFEPVVESSENEKEKEDGINRSITFNTFNGFNKISIKNLEDDRDLMPPVAMDMGVMNYNPSSTEPQPEYLFANGALARHDPTKEVDGDPYSSFSVETLDSLDTDRKSYDGDAELTYHSAYFAKLTEDSMEEKIMVVHSNADFVRDNITIHPSVLGVNENNRITYDQTKDDYINNKNEENDGTFLTFRPLNLDRDTSFYKYIGKEAGWSKPSVLSILPAAPMWGEFNYEDTYIPSVSYSVSKSKEESVEGNLSVGISGFYDGKILLLELGGDYLRSWLDTNTTTLTIKHIQYGNQDGVMFVAIPKTIYKYKRYSPQKIVTQEFLDANQHLISKDIEIKPGDVIKNYVAEEYADVNGVPILSTDSVVNFNKNALQANKTLASDEQIQLINMDEITAHGKSTDKSQSNVYGEPFSFPENYSEIKNKVEAENLFTLPDDAIKQKISLNHQLNASLGKVKGEGHGDGFSIDFSVGGQRKNKKRSYGATLNLGGGANWTTIETSGEAYEFQVPLFDEQGEPNTDEQINNYAFTTTPVLYHTSAYTNTKLFENAVEEMTAAKVEPIGANNPLVATHLVGSPNVAESASEHQAPPALPTNLRLYDRKYVETENSPNSNTKVLATLAWDLPTDEKRQPTHYEIYNREVGKKDWRRLTNDDTTPLKIPGDQNYVTVELEDLDVSKEYKLVSVNQINNQLKLESVTTQSITVDGIGGFDPIFISQPQPYWDQEEAGNPLFIAKISSGSTEKVSPESIAKKSVWQKLTEEGQWVTVDQSEGITTTNGDLVSLELVNKPSKITHYRLELNYNDCYFNYSDIANFYPLDSQQVHVDAKVLDTDTVRVTPTDGEQGTGYLASEVVTDKNREKNVTIQGTITDKDNVRVTEGTVLLRVNGELQDKVTLKNTNNLEEQGVATFTLPYQKEAQQISVEYIGVGNEPLTGYYPTFTLKGGNVEGTASSQQILYQLMSLRLEDTVQLLSPFDGERQLPKIERLGRIYKGWRIHGVDHEPLQSVSYEKLIALLGQARAKASIDEKLALLPVFENQQYNVSYHNLDGSEGFIGKELLQGKEGIRVSQPARLGYEFGGWYHDEGLTIPATEITLEPTKDLQYFAKWEEKTYTIRFKDEHFEEIREPLTYTASEVYNGGVSLGGTYHKDNSFTEAVDTLTPDYYGNLVVLAHSGETDPDVEPTEPEPDPEVTSFTVAASSEGGGTITPNGQITLTAGESQVFTMKPEAGNRLVKLELDGKTVAVADNQYTLENIQGNHKLVAYFEADSKDKGTTPAEKDDTTDTRKKGTLPKTGETRSIWQLVTGVCLLALGLVLLLLRRKSRND